MKKLLWIKEDHELNYLVKQDGVLLEMFIVAIGERKIKTHLSSLIFDDEFISNIKDDIALFDPVYTLINTCQEHTCSIAYAANTWLELDLSRKFKGYLENRKNMTFNIYALTAYSLHPGYNNDKLNKDNKTKINRFLLSNLNYEGLNELDEYREKNGISCELYKKNIQIR